MAHPRQALAQHVLSGLPMMHMTRFMGSAAFVLAAALFVRADDVDDLSNVVKRSLTSPHPMVAFYQGLAAMNDFDLREADVRRALTQAGAPPDGPMGKALGTITRLRKSGDRLRVGRAKQVLIRAPEGYTRLQKDVRARMRVLSNGKVRVDEIRGVKMGRSKYLMVPLRKVTYSTVNGRPMAKASLGYFPFVTTVTVELDASTGLSGSVPN